MSQWKNIYKIQNFYLTVTSEFEISRYQVVDGKFFMFFFDILQFLFSLRSSNKKHISNVGFSQVLVLFKTWEVTHPST